MPSGCFRTHISKKPHQTFRPPTQDFRNDLPVLEGPVWIHLSNLYCFLRFSSFYIQSNNCLYGIQPLCCVLTIVYLLHGYISKLQERCMPRAHRPRRGDLCPKLLTFIGSFAKITTNKNMT